MRERKNSPEFDSRVSATCQRPLNFAILDFWASFNFNNFCVFNGPLQFESLPGSQIIPLYIYQFNAGVRR